MGRPADDPEESAAREIRAQIAFEHMAVSSIYAAGVGGAAVLAFAVGAAAADSGLAPALLVEIFVSALVFAGIAFLAAFGAAAAIGVPLFIALEKARYRRAWPYFAAAFAVQLAAIALALGRLPDLAEPIEFVYFLPGLVFALLFSRRIAPVWRGAQRDEQIAVPRLLH